MKQKISSLIRHFMELVCRILSYFNPIIPKNKRKILIFNSKPDFMNNYAIFNYLIKHNYNEKYKIYYSMPNIEETVNKKISNVTYTRGYLKPLFLYLTSSYVFFDTGNMRIKPAKSQFVYNSWHGTPFKRIGFLSKNCEPNLPGDLMNTFTKVSVSGSFFDEIYNKSFNLKNGQISHIGQPRNDLLFSEVDALSTLGIDVNKYDKIAVWMTTYRLSYDGRLVHTSNQNWSHTNMPILISEDYLVSFNEELKKLNQLVIVKIHGTSKPTDYQYHNFSNIIFIKENDFISKGIQLYEILSVADMLITDYSSVYFDYLILNRPIAFIVDDIEDYEKNNGFNVENPSEFMPGEKILNYNDLIQFFKDCSKGMDLFIQERAKINDVVNEFTTRDNTFKTLELMGIKKDGAK